ncbi:MAG TPA: hypothetical protein VJ729_03320 [Nitrososphaeraceae archaeon]|nr:hypothetical protein [Nitrososphaeraceae archaeon]
MTTLSGRIHSDLLSILRVDDNHDIVRIPERDFSERGSKVSAFTDPIVALESLNSNKDGAALSYLILECLE